MTLFGKFFCILILHAAVVVYAQDDDQSGFISIDCGIPPGSNYTDEETGIYYVSDDGFIESGMNHDLSNMYDSFYDSTTSTLRSFPENDRNCYTLRTQKGKGNRYLIRAVFAYGNNDSISQIPEFDLYLGADYWTTVEVENQPISYEMIHLTLSDYINVCLVNTGNGNPFISALEVRLLGSNMYEELQDTSLFYFRRVNFGSDNRVTSALYKDDMYDRIWEGVSAPAGFRVVEASEPVSSGNSSEQIPSKVMSTAITPIVHTGGILHKWNTANSSDNFIFYLHFAEVETLESNDKREFSILLNENYIFGPFSPSATTFTFTSSINGSSSYTLQLSPTTSSTYPPILNAIEIYTTEQLRQYQTDDEDAAAIWSIKSTYGLKRNWQGDPCVSQEYAWEGLNCSYNDSRAARIISLNLSSSRLTGEIATALDNLTMIKSLDLSDNNLEGHVLESLAELDNLRILKLTGNNFTRPLPAKLLAKSKEGSLLLSIEESSSQGATSCAKGSFKNNKHNKAVIQVIATMTAFVMLSYAFAV